MKKSTLTKVLNQFYQSENNQLTHFNLFSKISFKLIRNYPKKPTIMSKIIKERA